MTGRIGIAGSGRAATAVLARLQAAGFPAIGLGATVASGLDGARNRADDIATLIAVPKDIQELEEILFPAGGFAETMQELGAVVIAATLSPRYVRALRGRIPASIALVDAPFSGSLRSAEEGRLSFFLGGETRHIAPLQPVFAALGQRSVRMGGFGTATAAKVLNDFLAASSTALTRIALDWAEAQGIEEHRILDMAGAALVPARIGQGQALIDTDRPAPSDDEGVAALMESVEMALDLALAEAHLTPPQAILGPCRGPRLRALH